MCKSLGKMHFKQRELLVQSLGACPFSGNKKEHVNRTESVRPAQWAGAKSFGISQAVVSDLESAHRGAISP
jgi:hypothetical protein